MQLATRTISRYDRILLDGAAAGKSPNELARLVNGTMSAEQCVAHVRKLLDSRNVWEIPEQKQLVLHELRGLADEMKEAYRNSGDSKDATLLLKTLTQVSTLINQQGSITEEDLKRVSIAQAREIVGFYTAVAEYVDRKLREDHPEIEAGPVREIIYQGIVEARKERYGNEYTSS